MSLPARTRARWTPLLLGGVLVAGCGKSSSQPTAPPSVTRQVAATVEDTTGVRQSGVTVWVMPLATGGAATVGSADASGVAHFSLLDGHYCLSASNPPLVAAAIGTVQQQPPGHPDSVLFRLILRPGSMVRGKVTLTGQSSHDGTIVGATEVPTFAITTSDGSYEFGPMPGGTWTGLATHLGYQAKLFDVLVPFPGDTVTAGPVVLVPGGPVPRP